MNIETVVKETIRELEKKRNYMRLHFSLTPELKKFYREQCLNYLLLCQQSILDYLNDNLSTGAKEMIKGEFDYISDCIRIRQRIDVYPVQTFNAMRESHYEKMYKSNGELYKTGFVASAPCTINEELKVTGKRSMYARTKTEAIAKLKHEMYKNSEYYGV
jgi:hypothetical protein